MGPVRGWKRGASQSFAFEAFGVRVGLEVPDPELEAAVAEVFPVAWRVDRAGEETGRFVFTRSDHGGYHVGEDGAPGSEHATLDVALGMLELYIEQFIALHAHDWVFIHAGAVSHSGKVLLIPGDSFSGKTTLVTALVEAGATYFSDEFAVLDPEGRVHAYPRRLSLRTADGQAGQRLHAHDLGGAGARGSAEVRMVVVTHYRPGADWRPRPLSPGQVVAALFGMTLGANERPVESMQTLRRAVAGATAVEGERGEAGPAAAALLETLAH